MRRGSSPPTERRSRQKNLLPMRKQTDLVPSSQRAGKAAHLAGVLAATTPLPVIGLPMKSSTMDGLDSLLSVVQMPKGVPVATVAINGAENAAILAVQILAAGDPALRQKIKDFKKKQEEEIIALDHEFQNQK